MGIRQPGPSHNLAEVQFTSIFPHWVGTDEMTDVTQKNAPDNSTALVRVMVVVTGYLLSLGMLDVDALGQILNGP